MFSSCYHMGELFELQCTCGILSLLIHPSCPFFLEYIFILKPALNSSLILAAHLGFILVTIPPTPPIIGGFSQIALIFLPPVSFCLLLSVSLPPPSLQILMSARSIMEAASTDVLTPGAPTTVNATRALACMWTVAPASVRNITAFLAVLTLYKLENNSYVSAH